MAGSKKYHPSEISLHTSNNDCWLVIHGKVYDVTAFLEDHPGGDEVLIQSAAAGDATDAFEDVGHSSSAIDMMERYFIGLVEEKLAAGGPKAVDGASTKGSLKSRKFRGRKAFSSSIVSFFSHLATRGNEELTEGSKRYHPSEISLHTSKKDCWLVIHGKVYDVTAFLEDHPGGDDILIQASGIGDATDAFEDVGHSSSAISMMERYFIGVVEGELAAGGPKATDGALVQGSLTLQERMPSSSSITSFPSHLVTRGNRELMEGSKRYHPAEISLHTSKKDCWLVIHGKVYDVTAFLEDHPGGDDVLLQAAGAGDATDAFEDVGHSSLAASMMEGYFIGVVEGKLAAGGLKAVDGASTEGSLESRTLQERKSSSSSIISFPSHLVARDNREFMEGSKRYHPSEISLHNSKKDCWLVIHGKVYDVTAFLEDHPGGDDVLIQAAGAGDATDAFEDVCHSSSATSMMERYFIGVVDAKLAAGEPKAADRSLVEGSLEKGKFIAFVSPEAETNHPEIELKPGIDLVGPLESYDATTYFKSAVMAGLSMHRKNTGKDGELPNSIAQSNKLKLFSTPQGSKEAKSPHQPSSNHEILFNSKVRGRQNQTDQSARADLAHLMETVGKSWRTISEYPESASEEDGELIFDTIVGKIDLSNLQLMNNEDLVELAELGSGAFGTVYHGQWRGTDVAIKRINKNCFTGRQDRLILETLKEAGILANLLHPNIVSLYGFVLDELGSTFAIVTELVADGSLRNILLREDKYLDHYTRLIIAKSAASGMEYLHLKKVVHFDLKCDNLLVDLKDPSSPICKVADFGLSKVKQETLVSGGARGTIPWMAPELFKEDICKVSEKIDVYSFGVVMWEILTGEVPYAGLSQGQIIGGIFRDTLRPPVPTSCDPRWRRLMEECWATDPQQRPSFTQIARRLHSMLVASHSEALK